MKIKSKLKAGCRTTQQYIRYTMDEVFVTT